MVDYGKEITIKRDGKAMSDKREEVRAGKYLECALCGGKVTSDAYEMSNVRARLKLDSLMCTSSRCTMVGDVATVLLWRKTIQWGGDELELRCVLATGRLWIEQSSDTDSLGDQLWVPAYDDVLRQVAYLLAEALIAERLDPVIRTSSIGGDSE